MDQVTIILTISREEYLQRVFSAIEMLDCNRKNVSLLAIVDGGEELFVCARNFVTTAKFDENLCVRYSKSDTTLDEHDILGRRIRIADIHNELKKYLLGDFDSKYVLGIEDDTVVPKDTIKVLLSDYSDYPNAGFIQAVELGRWGTPYVGAWKANDVYEPNIVESIMPPLEKKNVFEEIDAGGLFCFMSRMKTYIEHDFKPFDNNGMGPDINYGIELRRQGFSNYIDWRLRCTHLNGNEHLTLSTTNPKQVYFSKRKIHWSYNEK